MISTLIIDDEDHARSVLKTLITQEFSELNIVGEANDVDHGIDAIRSHKPDLVFLDIQLKSGTGFDLLGEVDDLDFEVIFVTAHNEYAITAFQFSAVGYLLKPLRLSELRKIVEKISIQIKEKKHARQRIKILIENYEEGNVKKLVVQHMQGFQVLDLNEIIYLEGEINYTRFILDTGDKILVSKTLKEYEKLLTNHGFFRIHQSYLINLRHVKKYAKGEGGVVTMSNGKELAVSRRKKTLFLKKFLG